MTAINKRKTHPATRLGYRAAPVAVLAAVLTACGGGDARSGAPGSAIASAGASFAGRSEATLATDSQVASVAPAATLNNASAALPYSTQTSAAEKMAERKCQSLAAKRNAEARPPAGTMTRASIRNDACAPE